MILSLGDFLSACGLAFVLGAITAVVTIVLFPSDPE